MADLSDPTLTATLGPWELNLVDITNEISHSIAETTYPYKNGADLEDMGVNPEIFRFSCVLSNDDYDNNYVQLRNWFASRFDEPITLFHPEHGELLGYPKNVSFSNDRRRRFAAFNFEFVVACIQPEIQAYTDPYETNLEEVVAVNEAAQAAIAEEMMKQGVPDVPDSDDWSLLDKWGELGNSARAFATAIGQAVGKINGAIEAVMAPIDAVSSSIDYVSSLSGSLTQKLQKACESFVALSRKFSGNSRSSVSTLVGSMSSFMVNLAGAPACVMASFASIAAANIATETARLMNEDEKNIGAAMAAENVKMEDADGRTLASDSATNLLSPDDLEDSLAISRRFLQDVLPIAVAPDSLKKQSATLADAVLRIKLEYMSTKTVMVNSPTPLHKIALDHGLNYKSAERLCALNDVKNPTFMQGEVLVYES